MLRLKNITKEYKVADTSVAALKGINLSFRKNEFVSILGPSGCGKTTTLNIIGGLDKYTDGDLFISGVSTKKFTDRDWDIYRNHRIGFIFQSYNLIPHQTILGNVELALTISGMSKKERQMKAKKALDRVGLANQYHKKPNQLSGGQCQRVAIARALVNEPEILLADEPTGALDTVTSVQIMDLIKEISKEKLVIMVTHNPELAEKYSTRIVRLLDGQVQEDTNPFSEEEEIAECKQRKEELEASLDESTKKNQKEKAKMSLWTAFKLSAKNLHSKFKRTFMVALAGCIGIIGVSTVLAVSHGVQSYITDMESDMLSGNPVYITTSSLDYSAVIGTSPNAGKGDQVNSKNDITQIYINSLVNTLYNMNGVVSTNSIGKDYMDFLSDMPEEACALIQYDYGDKIAPNLYTNFKTTDGKSHMMSVAAIQATYASVLKNVKEFADYASMISSVNVMTEMPSSADYIASQYNILYMEKGYTLEDVINDKSSLVAVASSKNNTLNDLELAEYGYFSQEQFLNYCYKVGHSDKYNDSPLLALPETLSYEELGEKKFSWYPNNTVFSNQGTDDLGPKYYASAYSDGSLNSESDEAYTKYKRDAFGDVDGKLDLNVKCVLKLKDDLSYGCLTAGGLYYTNELTQHMKSYNKDSQIVKDSINNGDTLYNIELGYKFRFDGDSKASCETYELTSSTNGAIMDYISQFFGVSNAGNKKVVSYSTAALGGAEYPSTVLFYCNDFQQKDLLTNYLDIWNSNSKGNLYKVDTNGFYLGKKRNDDGTEETLYYYRDENSNKYYQVKINSDGYVVDEKGNQYKLEVDEYGSQGFYLKNKDRLSDAFTLDGSIQVTDTVSFNVSTLTEYAMFGKEFTEANEYFDQIEKVYETNDYYYYYVDGDGNKQYLMKTKEDSFYQVNLDKNGDVISGDGNYTKYTYNEEEDKFYKTTYKVDGFNLSGQITYIEEKEEVPAEEISNVYATGEKVTNANVVKNPTYTILGNDYTIDTKGFYIDATSLQNLTQDDITLDMINNKVTIKDYSKLKMYYKDNVPNPYKYHYVEIDEDGYLVATDLSAYLSSYSIDESSFSDYMSTRYQINEDGTIQAVHEDFEDNSLTISQLLSLNILGDELTDLSQLEIDDGQKVSYTDSIGLIIGMVNTLINIITYALVAFTALSLVVSTVMIGIITYVSVVERTKEIGVIRALGGRKRDVSHLFNAETLIIGLGSGVLGIAITYLLSFVINMIIGSLSGIYTIASLPWNYALIMILLSVVLTCISGLIPARSAAKKDPVVALRSE